MDELQTLAKLSDDVLLERLGRELWREAKHAGPATSKSLQKRARKWLQSNLPRAKDLICGNPVVNAIRDKADEVTLAGALADILIKSTGFPVPATVAILIARIGLDRLCAGLDPGKE
jgi:hypothetical protein